MRDEIEMFESGNLSSAGERRREEILWHAIGIAGWRRLRRNLARSGAVALIGVIVVSMTLRERKKSDPPQIVRQLPVTVPSAPRPSPSREIVINWIKTDPTLADQLAVRTEPPTWRKLSDDELLRQLAAAGRPAALAYVDGKVEVLWRKGAGALPYR